MDTVGRIVDLVGGTREPSKSLSGMASGTMPLQEFQAVVADNERLRAENKQLRDTLTLESEYRRNAVNEATRLRAAARTACDLLAERTHGSPARSPGHNARWVLELALGDDQQLGKTEKP